MQRKRLKKLKKQLEELKKEYNKGGIKMSKDIKQDFVFNTALGIAIWGIIGVGVGIIYWISQVMSWEAWNLAATLTKTIIAIVIFTGLFIIVNYFTGLAARVIVRKK